MYFETHGVTDQLLDFSITRYNFAAPVLVFVLLDAEEI